MTDPRRVAAHLAEELAAVAAPTPAHDARNDRGRLVVVYDLPQILTFGTDGMRVWWQVRGEIQGHRQPVADGGLAIARDALVRAVHAKHLPAGPTGRTRAEDTHAASMLAEELGGHLLDDHKIVVTDGQAGPWPVTLRVGTENASAAVQASGGWFIWPDPHPDLVWHMIGLRRCLHSYRHIAMTRLLELLRAQAEPSRCGPDRQAAHPPRRPGAVA